MLWTLRKATTNTLFVFLLIRYHNWIMTNKAMLESSTSTNVTTNHPARSASAPSQRSIRHPLMNMLLPLLILAGSQTLRSE